MPGVSAEAQTAALPSEAIREILAWLRQANPATLLLICPPDSGLKTAIDRVGHPPQRLHLSPEADHRAQIGDRRFDFAVLADTLERLTARAGGQLLGRLRDLYAPRFLALVRQGGAWRNTELIAFGLRRCAHFDAGGLRYGLYRFNIHDYKDVPDWLNARYWAHPERWGKARW